MPARTEKTREQIEQLVEAGKPTQWKPGQSGNPSGRPATQKLSAAIRQVLGEPAPDGDGLTYAEAIARALAERAARGDVRAAAELADRAEGKATQSIDLEVTQLTQRFETMSKEELLHYAETGQLPEGVSDEAENI